MKNITIRTLAIVSALCLTAPAHAGWKLIPANQPTAVAKSKLTVKAPTAWNKWSVRPSKKGEIWTLDGAGLNELSFFAGIANGETIYKDRFKKERPLPKFDSAMLAPDIVTLFESSNRIILGTPLFKIDSVKPAKLGGHDGVHFSYSYTVEADNLNRRGEARAAVVGGKLYLINFVAPKIHFYDAKVAEVLAIMDSATL